MDELRDAPVLVHHDRAQPVELSVRDVGRASQFARGPLRNTHGVKRINPTRCGLDAAREDCRRWDEVLLVFVVVGLAVVIGVRIPSCARTAESPGSSSRALRSAAKAASPEPGDADDLAVSSAASPAHAGARFGANSTAVRNMASASSCAPSFATVFAIWIA